MLAFELPCIHSGHQGGNPIQWLCWGSRGRDAMCAKYCHIKVSHSTVPSPSVNHQENWWNAGESRLEHWCVAFVMFAVKSSVFNSLFLIQTKYGTPQLQTGSHQLRDGAQRLSLVFKKAEGEEGENNLPLSAAALILVAISVEGRRGDSHASSDSDIPQNVSLKVGDSVVIWAQ